MATIFILSIIHLPHSIPTPLPLLQQTPCLTVHDGLLRCGRESRLICQLSHSDSFSNWSLIQSHIHRLLYHFSFSYNSRIIKLLMILLFNFELQVDDNNVPEYPQIHSTCRSLEFSMHGTPSRFLSKTLFSFQRTGFWFWFHFPSFEGFYLFSVFFYKMC